MGCSCGKENFSVHGRNLKVVSRIAEGGFSVVDLMLETSSGDKKLYAVKRILTRTVEDEKAVLEEIKFHRMINHPNLIRLVDSAVVNPSSSQTEYLLVLPFYKNGSLESALKTHQINGTAYSPKKVLKIFSGICNGLEYLHNHENGPICHRDLKCANILFHQRDTMPVIMDFGSMTLVPINVTNRSQAMTIQDDAAEKCSILYRAPELFNVEVGTVVDASIDIWSLGCVLFALMYQENPFERCFSRGDSVALAAMGRNVRIPKESQYPAFLNDLIFILMAVEPTSRPDASTVASQINKHIDEMKTNSALENNNSSSGQKANGGTSSTKVVVDQVDIVAFERGDTNVPL
ncbi:serine/threonine-protein kinase 16-like [Convolutriloba macropyga]|uniref:serine/threonine-protein kinase 16-like n=1 Tax=Convolutriloba macropyga TaxID=536237 RepID=UPI003F528CD6